MTVGTFDFFIWTDAEFQCGSNGGIHVAIHALVLAESAFYLRKASDENINRHIQLLKRHKYSRIWMYSLVIGLYSTAIGQYTLILNLSFTLHTWPQ